MCAVCGLLAGFVFSLDVVGEGWGWLPIPAALGAFLSGWLLWRLLPERLPKRRLTWGVIAGGAAGLVSHYVTWYLFIVGLNLCYRLTGGCVSSLGDPPAGPLGAFVAAAGFTFFSWLILGWITLLLGAALGWGFARWTRAATEDAG